MYNFEVRFVNLGKMQVPDWIVEPFYSETEIEITESDLKDEFVKLSIDLEAKSLFKKSDPQ